MITFVCWKWVPKQPHGPRLFRSEHVNVLRAMLERHAPFPHKLVCITDDTRGLDPRIEALPMPETTFEELVNPHQVKYDAAHAWGRKKYFPNCYRRLWVFSREATVLGERVFALDIDVIVTGDLTPLVERDEDFVGWVDDKEPKLKGGAYLLRTGSHPEVWDEFDPETSPALAATSSGTGSDQAWMTFKLFPPEGSWGVQDGLVKINWLQAGPQPSTRLVFTAGHSPPWSADVQRRYPWVAQYWRM